MKPTSTSYWERTRDIDTDRAFRPVLFALMLQSELDTEGLCRSKFGTCRIVSDRILNCRVDLNP
jgi:hypothetical protein